MSQTFSVECPHCHAKGELADSRLLGQAIACPACTHVFMVVAQAPAPDPVQPPTELPSAPGPVAGPVAQQDLTADSNYLEPVGRSSFQGRKPPSKVIPMLVWGSIGGTIAVWAVMFLFGIPLVPTMKRPAEKVAKNEPRSPRKRPSKPRSETTIADIQPQAVGMDPTINPNLHEAAVNPTSSTLDRPKPGITPANGNEVAETTENIPPAIRARLDSAYGDEALPMLLEYFGHEHAGVRQRAAEMTGYRDPTPTTVVPLIKLLKDPAPAVRAAAVNSLGKQGIGSADVASELGAILRNDPVGDNRHYAADALKRLAADDVDQRQVIASILLPAFDAAPAEDLRYLAHAISSLGDQAKVAIPRLRELLTKQDFNEASYAEALAELGDVETLHPFISKKGIENYSLKTGIAAGLGRQKAMTPAMLKILGTLYQDTDEQVRQSAIRALQTCEPKLPDAIPLIEQAQADPHDWVREAAAMAITKYDLKPEQKVRGLVKQMTLAKPRAYERYSIGNSVREMKSEGLTIILNMLTEPELPVEQRVAAAQVLLGGWEMGSCDAQNRERLKLLMLAPQQPLNIRAACAVFLEQQRQRFDESTAGAACDSTLKEALAAPELDPLIAQQIVYAINRQDADYLPLLNGIAQRCEELKKGESSDEYDQFYQSILSTMAEFAARHRGLDLAQILPRYLTAIKNGNYYAQAEALKQLHIVGDDSQEAVEAARSVLHHEQSIVRSNAATALGLLHRKSEVAIPELQATLKDKDASVRQAAAAALGEFGSAAAIAVPDLVTSLTGEEKTRIPAATIALARIAPDNEIVIAALVAALDDSQLRDDAVDALKTVGSKASAAVPGLRKILPTSTNSELIDVLHLIRDIGPEAHAALPETVEILNNRTSYIREYALEAIGAMKDRAAPAIDEIVKAVGDDHDDVRTAALKALSQIGPQSRSAVPELEKLAAAATSEKVQKQIRSVISRIVSPLEGTDAIVFDLLQSDRSWEEFLEETPNEEPASVVQSLIRFSRDDDQHVKDRANRILANMTHNDRGREALQTVLNGDDETARATAAVLLDRLPAVSDPNKLIEQLVLIIDQDKSKRSKAVRLLTGLGSDAVPALVTLLTDEAQQSSVRYEVQTWLKYRDNLRVEPLLVPLRAAMQSDSPATRQAATLALAMLNPREPGVLPGVIQALDSEDLHTKQHAAWALSEMADNEVDCSAAIPLLIKVVGTVPKEADRYSHYTLLNHAVAALEKIGAATGREAMIEQLPVLRELLQKVAAGEVGSREYGDSEFVETGSGLLRVLAALGPQATVALPEIKAFLERSNRVNAAYWLRNLGDPVVSMLIDFLQSPEVKLRRDAVSVLPELAGHDERSTTALVPLLKDSDTSVRLATAIQLIRQPDHAAESLNVLREAIHSGSEAQRSQAIYKVRELGRDAAALVPVLLELSHQTMTKPWTRTEAIRSLTAIAPENPDVQAVFLDELRKAKDDADSFNLASTEAKLIPLLTRVIEENADVDMSRRAARLLMNYGDKASAAVPALKALMNSDSGRTGTTAAIALILIDPSIEEAIPHIIAAFDSFQDDDRYIAAIHRVASKISDLRPKLIEAAKRRNYFPLLDLVAPMGPAAKDALPQIRQQLQDNPDYFPIQGFIKGGDLVTELVDEMVTDLDNPEKRLTAIERLGSIHARPDVVIPRLLEFAISEELELRIAAISALSGYESHTTESVPLLAAALSDPDPRVARAAVQSLTNLQEHAAPALPQIIAALQTHRRATEQMLIHLLRGLGPAARPAVPQLEELTSSPNLQLRRTVIEALKAIQSETPGKTE